MDGLQDFVASHNCSSTCWSMNLSSIAIIAATLEAIEEDLGSE